MQMAVFVQLTRTRAGVQAPPGHNFDIVEESVYLGVFA